MDNLLNEKKCDIISLLPDKKIFPKRSVEPIDIIELEYGDHSMFANFISYILYLRSFDLRTGSSIKDINSEKVDMHHLFPKKAKTNLKTYEELYEEINSFANLMPIDSDTNKNYIKNKQPSNYYDELTNENKNIDYSLEFCFIDKKLLTENRFEEFINDRATKISNYINLELLKY